LDVLVVRKVGAPHEPELAMGAVGEGGVLEVERNMVRLLGVSDTQFAYAAAQERRELDRRVRLYRRGERPMSLKGEAVVIVDDGLATGSTALAACGVARARGATHVIVATPVTSVDAANRVEQAADQFVSLVRVGGPFSVGEWYADFAQTSDQEVINDLVNARHAESSATAPKSARPRES
jgi:predicted phosphoribosyltransferase